MERRSFLTGIGALLGVGATAVKGGVVHERAPDDLSRWQELQRELGETIVARWPDVEEHVLALTDDAKEQLVDAVCDAFTSGEPTDERARNAAAFLKRIPTSIAAIELSWTEGAKGLRISGAGLIRSWNRCAARSFDHAMAFHRHIARHFVGVIVQTKIGQQLPHLRDA